MERKENRKHTCFSAQNCPLSNEQAQAIFYLSISIVTCLREVDKLLFWTLFLSKRNAEAKNQVIMEVN